MSAPWNERHGAIWPNRASAHDKLVDEQYNSTSDAFTLIWQRAIDGFYEAEYLVKGKVNPQWSLPFWENLAGQGIFETLADARSYLEAFADYLPDLNPERSVRSTNSN